MTNTNFWRGKRVFITGHTGFIGGWLYYWLHQWGADLFGYALPPATDPNFFTIMGLDKIGQQDLGDIRDYQRLQRAISDFQPHIILHLAAQALVRPAFADPIDNFTTNVNGTIQLLDAARHLPALESIVVFTTDKVYENTEISRGYVETDRLGGLEPYGASKACAEIVTQSYWHSYFKPRGIPIATLRAGNVIGGGDWSQDRLIPDAARAFAKGEQVILRHPESVRPWQHVLEPCAAILRLVEYLQQNRPPFFGINIGPDAAQGKTVGWVMDEFIRAWKTATPGTSPAWQHVPDNRIYEAKLLLLDNALARHNLGLVPRWDAVQAIAHTANWYAAFYQQRDMGAITAAQWQQFLGE